MKELKRSVGLGLVMALIFCLAPMAGSKQKEQKGTLVS